MPHEILASLAVPLPDDPQEMAATLSAVAKAWGDMLGALPEIAAPAKIEARFTVNETRTRAKPAGNGRTGAGQQRRTTASTPAMPALGGRRQGGGDLLDPPSEPET